MLIIFRVCRHKAFQNTPGRDDERLVNENMLLLNCLLHIFSYFDTNKMS